MNAIDLLAGAVLAAAFACSSTEPPGPGAQGDAAAQSGDAAASACGVCAGTDLTCTFTRNDGGVSTPGTGKVSGADATSCSGTLATTNDFGSFVLHCDTGKICIREGSTKPEECYDATFAGQSFTYTIPQDGKVNTCTRK
jgi:hypothetical protein